MPKLTKEVQQELSKLLRKSDGFDLMDDECAQLDYNTTRFSFETFEALETLKHRMSSELQRQLFRPKIQLFWYEMQHIKHVLKQSKTVESYKEFPNLYAKFGAPTCLKLTKLEQDILVEASASMEMLQDYIAITDVIPASNFEPEQLEVLKDVVAQLRKKCSAVIISDTVERRIVNQVLKHEGFDTSDDDRIDLLKDVIAQLRKKRSAVIVPDKIERRIVNRILKHEGFDTSDGDLIEVLQEHKKDQTKLLQTVLVALEPLAEKLKAL